MAFGSSALAALTINSVSGVSASSTDNKTIYGGKAGTCASPSTSSTCNTCSGGTAIDVCNEKAIHPTLQITFSLTTDSTDAAGANRYVIILNSANTLVGTPLQLSVSVNSAFTYTTDWATLCSALGQAGCAASAAASFTIGLSTDGTTLLDAAKSAVSVRLSVASASEERATSNCVTTGNAGEGLCYSSFARGDSKAYVDDLVLSTDYPVVSGNTGDEFVAVRYYSGSGADGTGSSDLSILNSITVSSPYKRISLVGSNASGYALSDERVTGLENDRRQCMIFANETKAGNIIRFPLDSGAGLTTGWQNNSKFCVTPSKVVGLLDDKKCFIATAAFGSPMANEVQILRDFRDKYLKTNTLGAAFVETYYQLSPPLAQWISEHESVRFVVRAALWPLIIFSKVIVHFGVFLTLLFVIVFTLVMSGFVSSFQRKAGENV